MIRWAITHINQDGMRQLSFGNQGRWHYETALEAQQKLDAIKLHTPIDTLQMLYGDPDTMQVRPVDCYENGDAKGIYFD